MDPPSQILHSSTPATQHKVSILAPFQRSSTKLANPCTAMEASSCKTHREVASDGEVSYRRGLGRNRAEVSGEIVQRLGRAVHELYYELLGVVDGL